MNFRNFLLMTFLGALIIFSAINWGAVMAPTSLSLLFTTVQAPLGLILLTATALLAVLFLGFVVYMQTTVIIERQRLIRDLDAQRELANQAEFSRFTELRELLLSELQQLSMKSEDTRSTIETRLGQVEQGLITSIEQTGNTLSAYIGELEDWLKHKNESNP